jgi:hypothetical protein
MTLYDLLPEETARRQTLEAAGWMAVPFTLRSGEVETRWRDPKWGTVLHEDLALVFARADLRSRAERNN